MLERAVALASGRTLLGMVLCALESKNSLACTQNPLFVTSHGGLDMIFRDPTCPYGAVVVAVVVCVDVYY